MSKFITVIFVLIIITSGSLVYGQLPEKYHTYQEILDTFTILRNTYPEILYLDTLGYSSRDSLPMLRLKMSDNPQIDEDEPAIFYCGGVHADEVLGVEVVMNFIFDFVERYTEGDQDIQDYLQNLELFAVPMINPEGHTVVEGGLMTWRKNKSDNDTNGVFDSNDGVDNNRNYDFGWSIDHEVDAVDPESLQFKGFAPFTESENIAMAEFAWKYRPIVALDLHSPTYGRPNVAYYPWYWYSTDGGHGFGPDEAMMLSICTQYANRIPAIPDDSNTVTYTARRALVNKGDFKTYFYGNFGSVAFSVEISDTTIQDTSLVDSIVDGHLPGMYYLLDRSLAGRITGVIRDSVTLEPLEAEVQVTQHINADINPRLSRPDFGRYNRILDPGSYTLRFIKQGYRTKTLNNVAVNSGGPTTNDIMLSPLNPRPPAPELTNPAMHDTLDDNVFAFAWTQPSLATGYLLEVSSDPLFTTYAILDSNLAENQYPVASNLQNGYYYWRVRAFNNNGWGPYSAINEFFLDDQTGVDEDGLNLPEDIRLYQNKPNPFNATTQISFYLPRQSQVEIDIYNVTGALINRLIDSAYPAGEHAVTWNGTDSAGHELASGVYLYKFKADGFSQARRLMLLK